MSLEGRNSMLCPFQLDSIITVRDILPMDYERIIYLILLQENFLITSIAISIKRLQLPFSMKVEEHFF